MHPHNTVTVLSLGLGGLCFITLPFPFTLLAVSATFPVSDKEISALTIWQTCNYPIIIFNVHQKWILLILFIWSYRRTTLIMRLQRSRPSSDVYMCKDNLSRFKDWALSMIINLIHYYILLNVSNIFYKKINFFEIIINIFPFQFLYS